MNFLKNSDAQAAEDLLKIYGRFIRNYKETTEKLTSSKPSSKISSNFFQLRNDSLPENVSMIELLQSENKLVTKVLIVFFHLNKEARKLIRHSKLMTNKLIIIEDEIISVNELAGVNGSDPNDDALLKFSYALEDLFNMKFLIQNSIFLSVNVIQQYCALFSIEKFLHITPTSHFPSNLDDVVSIFRNLMILDKIFQSGIYKSYLELYCELLLQKTAEDDDRHKNLLNTLHELDLLLDGNIFQIALDNIVAIKSRIKPRSLKALENFLLIYIKNVIFGINVFNSNISELSDVEEVIKVNVAVVIYQRMFENLDPKLVRMINDINLKYPSIIIEGNIIWNGNDFLKTYLPSLEKTNFDLDKTQRNYMNQKVNEICRETVQYSSQVRDFSLLIVLIF